MYIPRKMTTNNAGWTRGWVYLRNEDERLPAFTDKVLWEKPDSWGWGVVHERQARLEVFIDALQHLVKKGLTAAAVIVNFHRQRVIPLMERRLGIFELTPEGRGLEDVECTALARRRCPEGKEHGGAVPLRPRGSLEDQDAPREGVHQSSESGF